MGLRMTNIKNTQGFKKRVLLVAYSIARFVIIFGLAFIILKPTIYKILLAFMNPDDLLDSTVKMIPRHFSLEYWKVALEGLHLNESFFNTVLLSLSVSIIQVISCTMIGYGLARFKFRGSNLASLSAKRKGKPKKTVKKPRETALYRQK